jgi:hypothetical protein
MSAKTETQVWACSFCGKEKGEVERLIAGPAVFICDGCVGLCDEILANERVASLPDLTEKSEEELLTQMTRLDSSRGHVERAVTEHARRLRELGVTWARIGEALGISRQSAWERFSGEE